MYGDYVTVCAFVYGEYVYGADFVYCGYVHVCYLLADKAIIEISMYFKEGIL